MVAGLRFSDVFEVIFMHQSFETPAPPPPPIRALAGDCGDFHLIYTPFWFPGRRGIRWKSRPSHPVPGELSGAVTPWSAVFIFRAS